MVRLLVFVAAVAGVTWGVYALTAADGGVSIAVAGYEYTLTPIAAAALLIVTAVSLVILVRLIDAAVGLVLFMLGDPAAVQRFTERTRRKKGVDTLDRTLMALAAGDAKAAQKHAKKAERLLRRPGLSRLLMAQALELGGDRRRARRYWRALSEEPATAIVGLKGLLADALAAGERERARAVAEQAAEVAPKDRAVLETLYGLESAAFDWRAARRTLETQRKIGAIGREEADRREAALAIAIAEEAEEAGDHESAKRHALEAARLDPSNTDAAVGAARHLLREGQKRQAAKLLIDAWRSAPAPQIARAFAEIEPEESAEARRRRFERLFSAHPDHRESVYVAAELALLERDWAAARRAIESLGEADLSARSCAVMAAVARGEGEPEAVVRGWLARALGAPREPGAGPEIGHVAMLPLLVEDPGAGAAQDAATARVGAAARAEAAEADLAEPQADGAATEGREAAPNGQEAAEARPAATGEGQRTG